MSVRLSGDSGRLRVFLGLYPRHGDDLHAGGAAQEELRAPGDHQGGGVTQHCQYYEIICE